MSEESNIPQSDSGESQEIEGSEQLQEGSEQELSPKQAKAEEKKLIRKLKLKFNGKEVDEELPFDIPEEYAEFMTKQMQMAKLSQHKSQEFSQLEREVGAFLQQLKENPRKALANPSIGIDVKKLAAEILEDEIAQANKTPEQIEREALQAELEALKAEREEEKQRLDKENLERLTEHEFERYDNLMSSALETSNLPKSPYVVKKMTEYMIEAVESGLDIEPKDVIPLIQEEMQSDVRELLRALPAEMVEKLLGEEIITGLRKSRVAAAKKPPVPIKSSIKDVGQRSEKKPESVKPMTIRDFFGT